MLDFVRGADFEQARAQWNDAMTWLLSFARSHLAASDVQLFETFARAPSLKAVSSKSTDFRGSEVEYYRPEFKQTLETFARQLSLPGTPIQARREAMQVVAEGLNLCRERIIADMRNQTLRLASLDPSLPAEVRRAFNDMTQVHLQELLRLEPALKSEDLSTPHLLGNYARAMGLPFGGDPTKIDEFGRDVRASQELTQRCRMQLSQRVTPLTVTELLAENFVETLKHTISLRLKGAALDLRHDVNHWWLVDNAVQELGARFGPVPTGNAVEFSDTLEPDRLCRHPGLVAIAIRRNMADQRLAPPPVETLLEEVVEGESIRRFIVLDERLPCVQEGRPGAWHERLPSLDEVRRILAGSDGPDGPSSPQLSDDLRERLAEIALAGVSLDDAKRWAIDIPSRTAVRVVLTRSEPTGMLDWLSRLATPRTPEGVMEEAFMQLLQNKSEPALRMLLDRWSGPGLGDAWIRQLRAEALRGRMQNTDLRNADEVGTWSSLSEVSRNPEAELMDRVVSVLKSGPAVADCRASLREFSQREPLGKARGVTEGSLNRALAPLVALRKEPEGRLTAPMLREDGKLSEALHAACGWIDARALLAELALIRRLAQKLALSGDEIGALLHVRGGDFPVPYPLIGIVVQNGRQAQTRALIDWLRDLHAQGLVDAKTAGRILLPDTAAAEREHPNVSKWPIAHALKAYLDGLLAAQRAGWLTCDDLRTAVGLAPPSPPHWMIELVVGRAGAPGQRWLDEWKKDLASGPPQRSPRRAARADVAASSGPAADSRSHNAVSRSR
ncbi:hypothetical protein CDN99_04025 [Roseateles aquatilis]|uniref:Uncharacterized protein n=2 Tax=Roseateles aquatilis TaxID=431061 RepID=A0A246JMA0_9BURK|nr:hypothetical protein CDN99_04025 [Roseateles aquatilis]